MPKSRGNLSRVAAAALVLACACASAAASCVADDSPPCQAVWRADVVFVGTVVELTYSEKYRKRFGDDDEWDARDRVAHFSVEEVFRGEPGAQVGVTATEILPTPIKFEDGSEGTKHTSGGDCEYKFKPGERYVVYANFDKARAGLLRVGLNRTRPLALAAEDLAFLRGMKSADPSTGRVYGRVVRRDRSLGDGSYLEPAPVEGVRVEVSGAGGAGARVAATDREGFYQLEGLAPGDYVVRASLPETLAAYGEQKARVEARGCARVDFNTYFDGRVSGRVTDAEGRAVAELKVDLIRADGPEVSLDGLWADTDKEGRYELKGVPPGRYLLGFGLGGEPDARAPFPRTYYPGAPSAAQATAVEVGPGQRLTLFDLRMPPRRAERTFEVTVVWPDGRPVEDAVPRLEDDDYPWSSNATRYEKADGAGRFRVTGFEGVTYWIHAYVNLKGGEQMHAEPVKFVLGDGAGPFRLVIASPGGNCTHYRGGWGKRQ
jgi:Carboxypeptidase regulatory-like domain